MTNQAILEKAIQKAIDGGWSATVDNGGFYLVNGEVEYFVGKVDIPRFPIERIIFNHDFAKALWGEYWSDEELKRQKSYHLTRWQLHLQQMVIAEDPIKYLGDNI